MHTHAHTWHRTGIRRELKDSLFSGRCKEAAATKNLRLPSCTKTWKASPSGDAYEPHLRCVFTSQNGASVSNVGMKRNS